MGLSAKLPPVYLNHVFVTVDQETYAAIGASKFLQDRFADVQSLSVQADRAQSWSGTYVRGRRTYLELFPAGGVTFRSVGDCGVGLGVETENGIASVYGSLQGAFHRKVRRRLRKRRVKNQLIPWFRYVYFVYAESHAPVNLWVMEYLPSYMEFAKKPTVPGIGTISRERYNAPKFAKKRYLEDITRVTIALNQIRRRRLARVLRALGYYVSDASQRTVCKGPGVQFVLVPSTGSKKGIVELKMSLLKPIRHPVKLAFGGNSSLRLLRRIATWTF